MKEKWISILRRIARIWSIVIVVLAILLLMGEMAGVRSVEQEPYPWWENLIPLTLALSVTGLVVAWKREGLGGAMTVVFAVSNLLVYLATGRDRLGGVVLLLLPLFIPGILFLVCWWGQRTHE